MEARDKKILVHSVSVVLIVVVLANVYRGITVSKVGIPGLIDIEFNSGDDPSTQSADLQGSENAGNTLPDDRQNGQSDTNSQLRNPVSPLTVQEESGSTYPSEDFSMGNTRDDRQTQTPPRQQPAFDLRGVWYGDDGSRYEILQSGSNITFTEYGLFGVTASGYGTISNSLITLEYETVFGTYGVASLRISNNGHSLMGQADDYSSGNTTFLNLTRE